MKLEKREITLNEYDSLRDIYQTEKGLLFAYAQAVGELERKQSQHALLDFMQETCQDLYYVSGLIKSSAIENK